MNNQLFIHLYVNKINSNIFKLFINFQYLFKLLFYTHTHVHIYIYIFLIEVSQFLLSRKKRDCINLSLSLSALGIFASCRKKKKKKEKRGTKPVEKVETIFPGWRLKGGAITGTIIEHCWVQVAIERASG